MPSTKQEQQAKDFGRSFSTSWFISMLNPKNRGPAWAWENFPARIQRMVEVSVFQSFSEKEWKTNGPKLQKLAGGAAREEAERLLEESAILDWFKEGIPHPPNRT